MKSTRASHAAAAGPPRRQQRKRCQTAASLSIIRVLNAGNRSRNWSHGRLPRLATRQFDLAVRPRQNREAAGLLAASRRSKLKTATPRGPRTLAKNRPPHDKSVQPASDDAYTIHLLAAATGELLNGLAAVAVSQFADVEFDVVSHPLQGDLEKLQGTLAKLSGERPIVIHALADQAAKQLVRTTCVVRRDPPFAATRTL